MYETMTAFLDEINTDDIGEVMNRHNSKRRMI